MFDKNIKKEEINSPENSRDETRKGQTATLDNHILKPLYTIIAYYKK